MSNPKKAARPKQTKADSSQEAPQITMEEVIPYRERPDFVAWHKANHTFEEHQLFLAGGPHVNVSA